MFVGSFGDRPTDAFIVRNAKDEALLSLQQHARERTGLQG
jgi:hypothetical protein